MPTNETARPSPVDRFLGIVERAGNLLPHPATLFFLLTVVVVVASGIASQFDLAVAHPKTGDLVSPVNLMSVEGLQRIMASLVTNFTGVAPLGTVLVALIGIGVAEHSGLIGASLRMLVLAAPKFLLTPVLVFAGVMSNMASEIGYVLLVPLGALWMGFPGLTPSRALAPFADPIVFLFLGGFALAAALTRHGLDIALAQAIGDAPVAAELQARISLSEAGMDWLWNEDAGAYCSRDATTHESSGLVTNASFLAFYAGVGSAHQRARLIEGLGRLTVSATYLLPSLEAGSRAYDHRRYWRGPVWLVVSYMVAQGLAEQGHADWAERIREDSARLIEASGFYESFSPETGEGSGGPDFSWTAAMWLAWCGQ